MSTSETVVQESPLPPNQEATIISESNRVEMDVQSNLAKQEIDTEPIDLQRIETMNTPALVRYCKLFRGRVASFQRPDDIKALQSINNILSRKFSYPNNPSTQPSLPSQTVQSSSPTKDTTMVPMKTPTRRTLRNNLHNPSGQTPPSESSLAFVSPISKLEGDASISYEELSSTVYSGHHDRDSISAEFDNSSTDPSFMKTLDPEQMLLNAIMDFKPSPSAIPQPVFPFIPEPIQSSMIESIPFVYVEREDEMILELAQPSDPSNPLEIPQLIWRKRSSLGPLCREEVGKRLRLTEPSGTVELS